MVWPVAWVPTCSRVYKALAVAIGDRCSKPEAWAITAYMSQSTALRGSPMSKACPTKKNPVHQRISRSCALLLEGARHRVERIITDNDTNQRHDTSTSRGALTRKDLEEESATLKRVWQISRATTRRITCLTMHQGDHHLPSVQLAQNKLLAECWHLFGPVWKHGALGVGIGLLSGILTSKLLISVSQGIKSDNSSSLVSSGASFAALCILSGFGTALAGIINTTVSQRIVANIRKDISEKILRSSIINIESTGSPKMVAMLTTDVEAISALVLNVANYSVAIAVTIGCLAYLYNISIEVFLSSVCAIAFGVTVNAVAHERWLRAFEHVRAAHDILYSYYTSIIYGAKELKIDADKRYNISRNLFNIIDDIAGSKNEAFFLFWSADAVVTTIYFSTICFIILNNEFFGLNASQLSGAVVVLLYAKAPIEELTRALKIFDQARVSFWRIMRFTSESDSSETSFAFGVGSAPLFAPLPFSSLELREVRYEYYEAGNRYPFLLGPIDMKICAGETVFIVGDNGSGKTTLLKLLLGLYEPDDGNVLLNGEEVTRYTRDSARQIFSAIFSDFYMFENFDRKMLRTDEHRELFNRMNIDVAWDGDEIDIQKLSSGQRRRLGLVQAYITDRPVIVSDEWASDQDPIFKGIFYNEIVPYMKENGRTIIIVSHDDSFFYMADRLIQISGGRIL